LYFYFEATGTGGGANARFEKLLASINQLRKEEAEEEGAQQEAFVPWTANQKTPEEVKKKKRCIGAYIYSAAVF
jgi:hypothetical protein